MYIENEEEKRNKNKHLRTHTHTHTLIYVKYSDHVLFRNSDPGLLKPVIREAIGWVFKETDEALLILFDRSVKRFSHEKPDLSSGLVLLKSDILEIKKIE